MHPTSKQATSGRKSWLWDRSDWIMIRRTTVICATALCLHVLLFQTGLFHELRARYHPQNALPPLTPRPHWVALPPSAFVDIGTRDDGSFSIDQLVLAWREAGLNPRQANQIAQQMRQYYTPVVMGVDDPILEGDIQRRAGLVAEQWRLHWPQANAVLRGMQDQHWQPKEVLDTETLGQWGEAYELLTQARSQLPRLPQFNLSGASMAQSRHAFAQAVGKAGLRSLRLSHADLQTPLQVQASTQALLQAERDMETITHWSVGVLGLYGRIALSLEAPENPADGGMTHDHEGNYITVQGQWDAISHEWLHALDIALARQAFVHTGRDTLSSNTGMFREEKNTALVAQWKEAEVLIIDDTPDWKQRRLGYALRHMDAYWLSSSEAMAYSFAEYAMQFHPQALNSSWVYDMPQIHALVPSAAEARGQAPAWASVLAKTRRFVDPADHQEQQ